MQYLQARLLGGFHNTVKKNMACALQLPHAPSRHGAGRIDQENRIKRHDDGYY